MTGYSSSFPYTRGLRLFTLFVTAALVASLHAGTTMTSNGVTWTLSGDHSNGTFVNGDPWVIGPVEIVEISNSLNSPDYIPAKGQNGSVINPGTDGKQGYDSKIPNYDEALNVAVKNGPISDANPLVVPVGSPLVSSVSWLHNSADDREAGAPKYGGGVTAPRPALRSTALLTVLTEAPAPDSFRPHIATPTNRFASLWIKSTTAYSTHWFLWAKFRTAALSLISWGTLGLIMSGVGWEASRPPSDQMPNYGRDMGVLIANGSLLLMTQPRSAEEASDRRRILVGLIQFGIDASGIADNGGGWPADGGHGLGRKWPILFAGWLLNDAHMLSVGDWKTRFHDDEQTFYVTQTDVDMTHSPAWAPDKRRPRIPYLTTDIGTPEWGIRHASEPFRDNAGWDSVYRDVNGASFPGWRLPRDWLVSTRLGSTTPTSTMRIATCNGACTRRHRQTNPPHS